MEILVAFADFCRMFGREEDCIDALFAAKWPEGFRCARCGHPHAYVISSRRLPLYECRACRKQTSLIAGTVMEGSRTPLRIWFQAIYLHSRPEGVNARQLSKILKVTYKTAWLICHKLRYAMSRAEAKQLLTGIVHVKNAIYHRKISASPKWHKQEHPLLAGASIDRENRFTRLKIKVQPIPDGASKYRVPKTDSFLAQHVDRTAQVVMLPAYKGSELKMLLGKLVWESESWMAKRFRGIGGKHLQVYLDHFCYMWNRRARPMFEELLRDCAITPAITYPRLTGSKTSRRRLSRTAAVLVKAAN